MINRIHTKNLLGLSTALAIGCLISSQSYGCEDNLVIPLELPAKTNFSQISTKLTSHGAIINGIPYTYNSKQSRWCTLEKCASQPISKVELRSNSNEIIGMLVISNPDQELNLFEVRPPLLGSDGYTEFSGSGTRKITFRFRFSDAIDANDYSWATTEVYSYVFNEQDPTDPKLKGSLELFYDSRYSEINKFQPSQLSKSRQIEDGKETRISCGEGIESESLNRNGKSHLGLRTKLKLGKKLIQAKRP